MTRSLYFLMTVSLALGLVASGGWTAVRASAAAEAQAGIEKLHQQDVDATLAHDPQALADLFTEDAVLLEPDSSALIGKAAILAANKKDVAEHPGTKVLSYKPEIKDIQIADGIAYEWDYFEAAFTEPGEKDVQSFRAKALRVLQRQPDGSWKFARVMWNMAENQSAGK